MMDGLVFDFTETEVYITSRESEFDLRGFLEKYTAPKIVATYGNLFKQYNALTPVTLHAILKMFHRYTFDMGYPALLCQASIFQTFQSLIRLAEVKEDLRDAYKFFQHFWIKFVKMAQENPKIFIEILFWKTGREAQEIQEGYAQYGQTPAAQSSGVRRKKAPVARKILTPEEENEIVVLAEEFAALSEKTMKQVDWINDKLIGGPMVKKVISKFLIEKGLLINAARQKKPRKPWSESDIVRLRETYEEFKLSRSIMRRITEKLTEKRSRDAIIDKMVEIQLIPDKSVFKSRKNKTKAGKTVGIDFLRENGVSFGGPSGSGSSSEDNRNSSDSEDENRNSDIEVDERNSTAGSSVSKSAKNIFEGQNRNGNSMNSSGSDSDSNKPNDSQKSQQQRKTNRKAVSDSDDDASERNSTISKASKKSGVGVSKISSNLPSKNGVVHHGDSAQSSGSDSDSNTHNASQKSRKQKINRKAVSDSDDERNSTISKASKKSGVNKISSGPASKNGISHREDSIHSSGSDSENDVHNIKKKMARKTVLDSDSDSDNSSRKDKSEKPDVKLDDSDSEIGTTEKPQQKKRFSKIVMQSDDSDNADSN